MAISMKFWKEKFPGVEESLLAEWLSDMVVKGVSGDEQVDFVQARFDAWKSEDLNEEDDDLNDDFDEEGVEGEDVSSDYDEVYEDKDKEDKDVSLGEIMKSKSSKNEDRNNDYADELDIPFENPDLTKYAVPEDEGELDDEDEGVPVVHEKPVFGKVPQPAFMRAKDEMVTKRISMEDYEEVTIRPFKPVLDTIRNDITMLAKLASNIEVAGLPPYMQYKPYIINHPVKYLENSTATIFVVNEANPSRLDKRVIPLAQAVEVTRLIAEQGFLEEAFLNYEEVTRVFEKDREALANLVFILEHYAESKQVVPFELSVPKKVLVDSIDKSFKEIESLITKNVIAQLSGLRNDLQGEMGSVGDLVEKNMMRFDTNIQDAVTKVLWKVKTDVESTNMEDIKKSLLWLNNKRAAAYRYGAVATAVMSVLLNDLEALLIEHDFMFDKIKKPRVYDYNEIKKRLFYKKENTISLAIPLLERANLIKVYKNKLFSLSL